MNTTIQISLKNVAHMLAGEWGEVEDTATLAAVADAIAANGDDPPASLVELLPVTVHVNDGGSSAEVECEYDEDYDDAARGLWADADYGDGDYRVTVSWTATDYAGHVLEEGGFELEGHTEEPPCEVADEHDWVEDGVWSAGGTSMQHSLHCRECGMKRVDCITGSQRNPGECDTTEYAPADDCTSD